MNHPEASRWCLGLLAMSLATDPGAAEFNVGPGTPYATVQDAIDAALARAGDDVIRVVAGARAERFGLEAGFDTQTNRIRLAGGWDPSFSDQIGETVFDGQAAGRVAVISLNQSDELVLEKLTFRNGHASTAAGLDVNAFDSAQLELRELTVEENLAEGESTNWGGAFISLNDSSEATLRGISIDRNRVVCTGDGGCLVGGLELRISGSGRADVRDMQITNNSVDGPESLVRYGGANVTVSDDATLDWADVTITDNLVSGARSQGFAAGMRIASLTSATVFVSRTTALRNHAALLDGSSPPQAFIGSLQSGLTALTDSIFAQASGRGLVAFSRSPAPNSLLLYNLTVADNAGFGLQTSTDDMGRIELRNSIIVGNGLVEGGGEASLNGEVGTGNNLIGVDPLFAGGSYQISSNSPAVDAGANSPPIGLGPLDITSGPRIVNGVVDIGAYEFGADTLFANSFEN